MNKEFYNEKIVELTDDRLIALLQKSNNESNRGIFELAKDEAHRRNLKFNLTDTPDAIETINQKPELKKLKRWNWGAFILAPIWTLANKLELWTVLLFIPVVNVVVAFYLGFNGNRLAFKRSKIKSVDDFMIFQRDWELWGLRLLLFGLVILTLGVILDVIVN